MLDLRNVRAAMLTTLLLSSSAAVAEETVELPSPEAREQMLQLLETQSLYRGRVDWNDVRAPERGRRRPRATATCSG